jgi:hypothetical protein
MPSCSLKTRRVPGPVEESWLLKCIPLDNEIAHMLPVLQEALIQRMLLANLLKKGDSHHIDQRVKTTIGMKTGLSIVAHSRNSTEKCCQG